MAPWSWGVRPQLGDAGWRGTSRVGNGWEGLRMKQGKPQGGREAGQMVAVGSQRRHPVGCS